MIQVSKWRKVLEKLCLCLTVSLRPTWLCESFVEREFEECVNLLSSSSWAAWIISWGLSEPQAPINSFQNTGPSWAPRQHRQSYIPFMPWISHLVHLAFPFFPSLSGMKSLRSFNQSLLHLFFWDFWHLFWLLIGTLVCNQPRFFFF